MNLWNETKSIPISRSMVWEAYRKVKANKGGAGVDEIDMVEYDANRSKYLYKLWNRMASGSYFPPPVKEVEISKKDGGIRKLGIPTISDRVGQMVVKEFIEPRLEKIFSRNSYGYRPNKNAHQALESVRLNCWKFDWVIDLDIIRQLADDNIDHNKLMLAVEKHVPENWVRLYIQRWLETPVLTKSGKLLEKDRSGTPQGGVISPLLANLFLHYAFDKWLELTDPTVCFARYADDAILHCKSKQQAEQILKMVNDRMGSCGLELHPAKTKIVYCRDYRRQGRHKEVKFDFLSFSFQPRTTKSKKTIHPEKSKLIEFAPKGKGKVATFDFLGFTHYWAKSQKVYPVVKRKTSCKKMQGVVKDFHDTCMIHKHERLKDQFKLLASKLRSRYQYYGIRGNFVAIRRMYQNCLCSWFKWLNRRSQRKSYTWSGFYELLKYFTLPKPKIVHYNV